MDKLEKQLISLPKMKLSHRRSFQIRWKLFLLNFQKTRAAFGESLKFRQMAFRSVAALLFLALITVLPAYAYAGENVLPDNPLYFLKQAVEKAEVTLTPAKAKPALYLKLAERRLAEANVLAQRSDDEKTIALRVATVKEAQIAEQKATSGIITNIKPVDTAKIQTQINELNSKTSDQIKKIADDVTIEMNMGIIESVVGMLDEQSRNLTVASSTDYTTNTGSTSALGNSPNNETSTSSGSWRKFAADHGTGTASTSDFRSGADFGKLITGRQRNFGNGQNSASSSIQADIILQLNALKTNYGRLNATDSNNNANNNINKLLDRMKEKMASAEQKIKGGDANEAKNIMRSADTLEKFTSHLLRGRLTASSSPVLIPDTTSTITPGSAISIPDSSSTATSTVSSPGKNKGKMNLNKSQNQKLRSKQNVIATTTDSGINTEASGTESNQTNRQRLRNGGRRF